MSLGKDMTEPRGAMTASSVLLPQKGVTIFDEPEHIPNETGENSPTPGNQSPRIHRASISGKKMTGRPAMPSLPSTTSMTRDLSNFKLEEGHQSGSRTPIPTDTGSLLGQVMDWLHQEKAKRHHLRAHLRLQTSNTSQQSVNNSVPPAEEQDLALDKLEEILATFAANAINSSLKPTRKHSVSLLRRGSIARKMKRGNTGTGATSDTDAVDSIAEVPHVESALDNSKTMAFTGGETGAENNESYKQKDEKNWITFKQEIVRLTHTLKLRGWRRIPIEQGSLIHVERLSGALTNAVYVVKAPKEMPDEGKTDDAEQSKPKRKPLNLLLRIYGPQVEHLIDRENELSILRRLAAKHIGPRLLGYFSNGRFEEFLHAKTLVPEDLRDPDISKQIAKRMRELHEGIELLESERSAGPFVFRNWDKWVDRCEKVITWLDMQVKQEEQGNQPRSKRYTRNGLICGVEWPTFRAAVERYRSRLIKDCGGDAGIRNKLVFAHNDTQYGNLMRLTPPNQSPLLQPVNQHKQLVVIDFEYASANTAGLEFANHFTEWCYNYHHPQTSFACQTNKYPTPQEQYRFVRAYVMHRPQFNPAASATPRMDGREKTNISDFMLDARTPGGSASLDYDTEEKAREQATENEIQTLLHQTRLWRLANTAQWVAWGIVQAKVPELDEAPKKSHAAALLDKVKQHIHPRSDPLDPDVTEKQEAARHDRPEGREQEQAHAEGEEDEEEDFDYLAYAQDRAMFFWGDCIQMGIVKEEDLPESMRGNIKYVRY